MSEFPHLPYTLRDGVETETRLLTYLKKSESFSFLEADLREEVCNIPEPTVEDPQRHQESLLELWPRILTAALLRLKKNDLRECDPHKPDLLTFFHSESLGIQELREILDAFSEFEGLLYGASPDRYRDHIMHSFRVWIVGHAILTELLAGELSTGEDAGLQISGEEWQCMWALVALCHDIGYPLGAIEKINGRARDTFRKLGLVPSGDLRFAFQQQMLPFHDTIIRLIASKPVKARCDCYQLWKPAEGSSNADSALQGAYLTHLQNKYYLKLLKSFDRLDHGIVSSLLMSRSLVYFLESDFSHDGWKALGYEDCRQFLIRREILRAVASHTCPDIYHLCFNTLSFLLYIADEMQCWGRPTFEELQHKPSCFGDAHVTLREFSKDCVSLEICMGDTWDQDQQEAVGRQVSRLRRMIRLAVDTPHLANHRLHFRIFNSGGQECRLDLEDGRIQKRPAQPLSSM